jgi:hypothetical protein
LKYGQEIITDGGELSIIYHIFPKLLVDNQFFKFKLHKEIHNYTLPIKYAEEIDKINSDVLVDGDNFKIYTNYNYSKNYINAQVSYTKSRTWKIQSTFAGCTSSP